jgi:4-methyl-5(b-hydroxyethyl)-thiazole monophosphate biosynthesis
VDRAAQEQILILLAPGFEESDAIAVARRLRQAGLSVVLVGLSANPMRGAYGLSLAPDQTLSQVEADAPRAVVLPRGKAATWQLAGDPRVHALLHRVLARGGYVVALGLTYTILQSAGALAPAGEVVTETLSMLWDGEGLDGDRTAVEGQVVFSEAAGSTRQSAWALVSLLQGSPHG